MTMKITTLMTSIPSTKLEDRVLAWYRNHANVLFPKSEWVQGPDGEAYIRHQTHYERKLTIANITIKKRRKGTFKSLLKHVEHYAREHAYTVVVECIMNPHLYEYLQRQGYTTEEHRDPRTLIKSP
jgi:hypothetical protein